MTITCFALDAYSDAVACGSADYDAPFTFIPERVTCPACLKTAQLLNAKAAR